jgi:hypothetical protein
LTGIPTLRLSLGTLRRFSSYLPLLLATMAICLTSHAQSKNFFTRYQDRVRFTSAQQPGWPVPVVGPSSVIVQLARFDFVRQYTPTHTLTEIYGNGKGFNFIPFYKTEVDINVPPLIQHNTPNVIDGAGDFSMVLKYRLFAGNEKHHNYSVSAQVQGVGATGSYKNGTLRNQINPTLIAGKGFGRFDVQSGLGGVLPVGDIHKVGRTITWNTTAQYRATKILWPEIEVNSSYYHLGPNDGKNQTFITPGLMVSKIKLRQEPKDRLSLVFGAGMQIATSHYHSYNHALVLTGRITF